ncbi:MAG: Sir2 family NAD-dependent protein deacetylase [Thermacetogeniaceae bacterium]
MSQNQGNIERASNMIAASRQTVVVTGAGISTEAGIPDFRGANGIYRTLGECRVMNIINIEAFRRDPRQFYEFYRQHFIYTGIEPSHAHRLLAGMEKSGLVKVIVTQNIDDLHARAGSQRVIAVHGNAGRFVCTGPSCNKIYNTVYVQRCREVVPTCAACGSILKPDVVLFGETIQNHRYARETILGASLVIVIGSSLTVYPLAGFVEEYAYNDGQLIIINKGATALDHKATVRLETGNTGALLDEIDRCIAKAGRE